MLLVCEAVLLACEPVRPACEAVLLAYKTVLLTCEAVLLVCKAVLLVCKAVLLVCEAVLLVCEAMSLCADHFGCREPMQTTRFSSGQGRLTTTWKKRAFSRSGLKKGYGSVTTCCSAPCPLQIRVRCECAAR